MEFIASLPCSRTEVFVLNTIEDSKVFTSRLMFIPRNLYIIDQLTSIDGLG